MQINAIYCLKIHICSRNVKTGTGTINPKSGDTGKKKCLRNTKTLNLILCSFLGI